MYDYKTQDALKLFLISLPSQRSSEGVRHVSTIDCPVFSKLLTTYPATTQAIYSRLLRPSTLG